MMNQDTWLALQKALGFKTNLSVFEELMHAHSMPQRFYHSAKHISACLEHLETVKEQVEDWNTLALAFWFHDAVYKPFSSTNERDSADWAVRFLKKMTRAKVKSTAWSL